MPREPRLRRLLALCLLLLPMGPSPAESQGRPRAPRPAEGRAKGPNILILVGDDHRGGILGVDGDPRGATPRLDELARAGVRFDRAYCNAPVCTASRQSFLTGRLPHAVGVTRLTTPLPDDALTLAEWLSDLGYDTAAFGKMHFNSPKTHGFAERLDGPDWAAWLRKNPPAGGDRRRRWRPFVDPASTWLNAAVLPAGLPTASMEASYYADRASEFFEQHGDRSRSNPFFLVVGFNEPHSPFKFPDDWPRRFRPDQFALPAVSESDRLDQPKVFAHLTPGDVRGIQAAYYTSVSWVDDQVGRIIKALDASGLGEETIVVYLGDNGYMLGDHGRFEKHCSYEPAVRVPLIVRWNGHLPSGRKVGDLVELVDLVPTLLGLAGQPLPPDLHGSSLEALLRGDPGANGHDFVVSEYLENEEAMVRTARYKLVVGTGGRKRLDGYDTGRPLPGPYERLFDLDVDPGETTDLRDRPDLAPVVADLRHKLCARLTTTRSARDPVPAGLSEIEAIRRCLVPRD